MGSHESELSMMVEDRQLRRLLIEVSMTLEKGVSEGKIPIDHTIKKTTPFGLEIQANMSRPREDKPIVFNYQYRVNRAAFKKWVDDHAYMFGGDAIGFKSMGITIFIPGPGTEKYHKSSFTIVIKYGEDEDNEMPLDLLNQTATFTVHREVVSEHDWIVKVYEK